MFYCEQCRAKNNWPYSIVRIETCERCGSTEECYDTPSVMLIPDKDRTVEQKLVLKAVLNAFREMAEAIVVTTLGGRVDNRLTDEVRGIFAKRNNEIDWYATYQARLRAQECLRESDRAERDRRQR